MRRYAIFPFLPRESAITCMVRLCRCILLPLALLTALMLASCGGKARQIAPESQLQVKPLPSLYVQYDSRSNIFRIGNELVERRILISPEKQFVYTVAFINKLSGRNYVKSPADTKHNSKSLSTSLCDVNDQISPLLRLLFSSFATFFQ